MQALLALADEVPNYDAIALSPGVGWILLAAVVCLALFFIAHRDAWRKLWLRVDDPRPLAAMRIVFGLCAMCNVNELWELFGYLFTDEGIFSTDLAQHYRARSQFAGYGQGTGPEDPRGFFTFAAFLEWLKGPNYSLLLFNSSPKFFWGYLIVFEVVMLMFIVGFKTQWTKWIAWFLFMGIILRNTLFWEATENVYRVFFLYLCLSRCGEAWSVDNWLRCRKLRKQGRLSEPGKPGEGAGALVADGPDDEAKTRLLEPIYRPIPGWPRILIILNIGVLYCATGTLKNGPRWNQGNAFYYAFNLDHFYRLPPQQLSSWFGTTIFRLNTWVVHWWEALFPLLILGMILRWHRREKIPRLDGWKLWLARLGLGGFVFWFYALILYSYPVHYRAPEQGFRFLGKSYAQDQAIPLIQGIVGVCVPLVAAGVVLGYRWLRDRQDVPREQRGRLPWLDLDWVCRWLLGRRVWLVLGLIFHGHLILTMNIGWFSPGVLACYFAFLNGAELGFLTTKIGQGFHKAVKLPVPAHVRAGQAVPPADLTLPRWSEGRRGLARRDGHVQPWAVLFTALGLALLGVVRRVQTDENLWAAVAKYADRAHVELPASLVAQTPVINANWFVAMIAVFALVVMVQQTRNFAFNPWFGPVVILTAWLGSVLAERELVSMAWVVAAVGVVSFLACLKPGSAPAPLPVHDPETGRLNRPWAYKPLGRTVVVVFTLYHMSAVAATQFPDKDSWSTFHRDIDHTFSDYLQTTQSTQGWGMFAPNPPTHNVFLRVTVTDQNGEVYDLNTDVYACFMPGASEEVCDAIYPIPWIWYTRQRKINRRIAGSEGGHGSWYQAWHARWVCRQWQLEHGELPDKVELYKVSYPIPPPEEVFGEPYDPKTQYNRYGNTKKLHTTECRSTVAGQLSNEVRERHGLEPVPEDEIRVWKKRRCANWEQKLIDEARERGEDVDVLDPRFDVCPDAPREVEKALFEQNKSDLLLDD